MFSIFLMAVTVITASLPLIVRKAAKLIPGGGMRHASTNADTSLDWMPVLAALLFIGAFFLPDINISDQTSTFQQHFVGGGLYCVVLFEYFRYLLGWRFHWLTGILLLFAWTSALGVANELLELILTELRITIIHIGDADWDLLANTLGAFAGYVMIGLARLLRRRSG